MGDVSGLFYTVSNLAKMLQFPGLFGRKNCRHTVSDLLHELINQ